MTGKAMRRGFCAGVLMVCALGLQAGAADKMAAIFSSNIGNPYDGIIHQSMQQAAKDSGFEYDYIENVTPDNYERVLREYGEEGYKLVVSSMTGHHAAARKVAKDYPEMAIMGSAAPDPQAPNFSVFNAWVEEAAYLCGMIAGKMTKSDVIGAVAGFPTPDANYLLNAYRDGAKAVNPAVKFKVTFIGSWFDPPKAQEATKALISAGADMIYAERYGVTAACNEMGVYAFGSLVDKASLGPDTIIASAVWDFTPAVVHAINGLKGGTYTAEDYQPYSLMKEKGALFVLNPKVWEKIPDDVRRMVEEKGTEIESGAFQIPRDKSKPTSD